MGGLPYVPHHPTLSAAIINQRKVVLLFLLGLRAAPIAPVFINDHCRPGPATTPAGLPVERRRMVSARCGNVALSALFQSRRQAYAAAGERPATCWQGAIRLETTLPTVSLSESPYRRPIKARIMTMTRITPRIPPGPYPQLEL